MTRRTSVQAAVAMEHPPKDFLRRQWVQLVREFRERWGRDDSYIYLTLPGAEGRDLAAMIDAGLMELTETGALTDQSARQFCAVENDGQAVYRLNNKYAGLKIYEQNIGNLLRGARLTQFPTGQDRAYCLALVANLDFNSGLVPSTNAGDDGFPLLILIQKLAVLHREENHQRWALCLTFNTTTVWSDQIRRSVSALMRDNMCTSERFARRFDQIVGDNVGERIRAGLPIDLDEASEAWQKFVMCFVPKKIADLVQGQHWFMEVNGCYRYRSAAGARMASWIIEFQMLEDGAGETRQQVYRDNVARMLCKCGHIAENGEFHVETGEEEDT